MSKPTQCRSSKSRDLSWNVAKEDSPRWGGKNPKSKINKRHWINEAKTSTGVSTAGSDSELTEEPPLFSKRLKGLNYVRKSPFFCFLRWSQQSWRAAGHNLTLTLSFQLANNGTQHSDSRSSKAVVALTEMWWKTRCWEGTSDCNLSTHLSTGSVYFILF